jgi:hypothetical protein
MRQGCFTKRDKRDLANTSPPWSRCCDSLRTWCLHRVAFIISVRTLGRSSYGRRRLCIDSLQIRVGCNGVHASIDAWSIDIRPCTLYKMSVQLRSRCRYVMSASITDRPQCYRHIIDVVTVIRVVGTVHARSTTNHGSAQLRMAPFSVGLSPSVCHVQCESWAIYLRY